MQQFRSFPSFQDEVDDAGAVDTDRLVKETQTDALSLLAALQSTMTANTTGRMLVIPGAKKRNKINKAGTTRRHHMNPRLRFGLICGILLFVLGYTLFTLSPLAAGQGGFPGLSAFGNWVQQEAINLAIASHIAPPAQQQTTTAQSNQSLPLVILPKSQYIAIAQQDATAAGISPDYFVRQINQESGFNPNAVSPSNAEGIAQFED